MDLSNIVCKNGTEMCNKTVLPKNISTITLQYAPGLDYFFLNNKIVQIGRSNYEYEELNWGKGNVLKPHYHGEDFVMPPGSFKIISTKNWKEPELEVDEMDYPEEPEQILKKVYFSMRLSCLKRKKHFHLNNVKCDGYRYYHSPSYYFFDEEIENEVIMIETESLNNSKEEYLWENSKL